MDESESGPVFRVKGDGDFWLSDSLSFEGVESINPATGESTGHELRVACHGYDQALGLLSITPQLITSGPYRNASALPRAGARITNHSKRPG